MKHKIRIMSLPPSPWREERLWYVECSCGSWAPSTAIPIRPGGPSYFGRTTWDAAFATGIAHQKEHQ